VTTLVMIAARGLVKNHGSLRVLDGASLAVAEGEVAVIIGPSGSGKSTLLRCLNGLEAFDEGEVRVGDVCLGPRRAGPAQPRTLRELRRKLGMVFQQFHLFPHMSVLDNVTAGPRYVLGQRREEAEAQGRRLLARVGLADKLRARPDQLSGGQQQRVAIARALMMRPEAILFDEPTSALDPRMAAEVLAVMADLARSGQTMVVVTHAMGFARQAAHQVHVMDGGALVESGPPKQVFGSPRTDATKSFLAELHAL
jgi:ABC-type polar amino acid transport system ATPase subunit